MCMILNRIFHGGILDKFVYKYLERNVAKAEKMR